METMNDAMTSGFFCVILSLPFFVHISQNHDSKSTLRRRKHDNDDDVIVNNDTKISLKNIEKVPTS